ncbi:MAG TPA: DUF2065 domain-containing protein [Gammaproteobacteria bacterium]|jgi:hypothetical protein|nr:DUF2065 domain-containing protein [Gammaproteobacteria bacterium]
MFDDLLAALALLLVVEGILPFLNPDALRRTLQGIGQMDDRSLRVMGLVSMLSGVALLYLVR